MAPYIKVLSECVGVWKNVFQNKIISLLYIDFLWDFLDKMLLMIVLNDQLCHGSPCKNGLRFRIPHTIKNSSHKGGDAVTDVS